jgi:hypothetical protein
MREQGFDYTFLIPQEKWLFDFYGKFGYKPLEFTPLQAKHGEYPPSVERPCSVYTNLPDPVGIGWIIYPAYFRFLSEIPQAVLKTEEQFRQILLDFFNENGVLFANEQGIAFTLKEKHRVLIKEFFYQDSNIKDLFLKDIRNYYPKKELVLLNTSDHLTGKQGMIKQLNSDKPKISSLYINMMLD